MRQPVTSMGYAHRHTHTHSLSLSLSLSLCSQHSDRSRSVHVGVTAVCIFSCESHVSLIQAMAKIAKAVVSGSQNTLASNTLMSWLRKLHQETVMETSSIPKTEGDAFPWLTFPPHLPSPALDRKLLLEREIHHLDGAWPVVLGNACEKGAATMQDLDLGEIDACFVREDGLVVFNDLDRLVNTGGKDD